MRTSTPPLTQGNGAIDPLVSDDELVMDWIDRMQRSTNPFVERLTFFWHRHWAVTRDDGIPAKFLLTYADRLRSYADLGANPSATFRDLAYDMTTKDGAMSLFLNGTQNTRTRPNENYAREFMELFCLGVVDAQGNPNYTQTDVSELARAFTGWRVDQTPTSPTYGVVSFQSSSFDSGTKTILGKTAAFTAARAADHVLAQPAHAPYLVRKLWGEFIAPPPAQATVDALASAYKSSGLELKPDAVEDQAEAKALTDQSDGYRRGRRPRRRGRDSRAVHAGRAHRPRRRHLTRRRSASALRATPPPRRQHEQLGMRATLRVQ